MIDDTESGYDAYGGNYPESNWDYDPESSKKCFYPGVSGNSKQRRLMYRLLNPALKPPIAEQCGGGDAWDI